MVIETIAAMQVELLDHMGDDLAVVNAARISYGKTSAHFADEDDALLKKLGEWDHWSPFAHTAIKLRITAPIYVARQLAKHQVGLTWNEKSLRYTKQPHIFEGTFEQEADASLAKVSTDFALKTYEQLLAGGVHPEKARAVLPLSVFTTWIWTGSLAAFARVHKQRSTPQTQSETRAVAEMIWEQCKSVFPKACAALEAPSAK